MWQWAVVGLFREQYQSGLFGVFWIKRILIFKTIMLMYWYLWYFLSLPFNVTQICKIYNFIGIKCKNNTFIRTNLFNNNALFCFVQLKSGSERAKTIHPSLSAMSTKTCACCRKCPATQISSTKYRAGLLSINQGPTFVSIVVSDSLEKR